MEKLEALGDFDQLVVAEGASALHLIPDTAADPSGVMLTIEVDGAAGCFDSLWLDAP